MARRTRAATLASILLATLAATAAASAGVEEPDPAADARLERALELRRRLGELERERERLRAELDGLLEDLTPEQRRELEMPPEPAPPVRQASDPETAAPAGPEPEMAPVEPEPAARCGTLDVLDSNGDGAISGQDRNWRYLSLWKDDGDGTLEPSEVRSLFRHGIRRVSVRLFGYTTARDTDGAIRVEDRVYFDLPGRRARAALAIDAGRLARGGELWLEDASGARLDGAQVLRAGLTWVASDGGRTAVLCAAAR